MTPKRLFSIFATGEAITWALLILGMVLKYGTKTTDVMVSIGGGLHGFVFLCYIVSTVFVGVSQRWSGRRTALGLASAIIPFATIPFESATLKSGALDGDWQLAGQREPESPVEKIVAACIRHPFLALGAGLVVVAVVFSILLMLGPPGEWGK